MRMLFACLARYDGCLSALIVRSQEPWTRWAVCLRETRACFGPLSDCTRQVSRWAVPRATAPAPAVLRALDVLERGTPRWWGAWMEATCPERGEPCYRLISGAAGWWGQPAWGGQ